MKPGKQPDRLDPVNSRVTICLILLLAVALIPANVEGQYFGQNKVRYESPEFKVLQTEHFDIHYYDEEAAAVKEFGRMAERWYVRLSNILDHQLSRRQPIIVYASHPAFRGTTVIPDMIGETTGGVTEGLRRRIVMPFSGPLKETDHVLGHELVHAFQFDITFRGDAPAAAALPLWFVEGMAEYLSLGPVDSQTSMWMRDAIASNRLPTVDDLDDPDYFPYRYGHALWAYIGGKYGDDAIGRILRVAGDRGDAASAIRQLLGVDAETLSADWHTALKNEYSSILSKASRAADFGRVVVQGKRGKSEINVAPSLSPDGSRMVFFSERGLFSIDLYLADARTGAILDKITRSALDAHIDSLEFVNSAGAWSHDGEQFAFGSIRDGRPEISVYDVQGKRVVREIRLPTLGEIYSLTWSPDGQSIALSGMAGGVTDLFVVDLKTENLVRLTDDPFADLQPAWSPDGTSIAFVTDRFTTDLETLSFGFYGLALVDPSTRRLEQLRGPGNGKQINPQWSADGRSIYFVSDQDGIPNVYRIARTNNAIFRVTDFQTGVSGIVHLSPAISVASSAPALVFSLFSDGAYSLRRLDEATQIAGTPVSAPATASAAILPPRTATAGTVTTLLSNPRQGLRSSQEFTSRQYDSHLSLEYIAPASVEVGVSNFGSLVGGGTTFVWSDLLGQHHVFTTVQSSFSTEGGGFLNNLALLGGYQNDRKRWTWGFSGGQVPYLAQDLSREITTVEGRPVIVDRSVLSWQINREILGYFAYPFNRAQRLEFSTGYRRIGFDAKEKTDVFDGLTGQFLGDQSSDLPSPDALNLGTGAAALVYDTSIFGGTSPVAGRRYRFEVGGTAGSLGYGTILGDFRQYYQIARPLSLAGRVLYFGRFGGNAEDPRLQDLFVGYDSLVRGYNAGSFTASECGPAFFQFGTCPVFDRLFGSRMAVANAEVRVPLLGALGLLRTPRAPPVETALFYDAGVAWTRAESANFLGGSRRPVTSYGGSLRVNLLGFAIAQISLVHPNSRPAKGWAWEFSLLPGF